jgi:hypothetical protein
MIDILKYNKHKKSNIFKPYSFKDVIKSVDDEDNDFLQVKNKTKEEKVNKMIVIKKVKII